MSITSELLNGNSQNIMRTWEKRAKEQAAAEMGVTVGSLNLVLEKKIPEYLMDLSGNLSGPQTNSRSKQKSRKLEKKEMVRVNQVLEEYHILRQVIFQTLEGEGRLDNAEREIINDSIDEAVADSTAKEFLLALKAIQEKVAINLIHDLRTPITVAKLSADIIKMNPGRSDLCLKNSKRIIRSMEKMEKMVSNLMNITEVGL